jgi:serine/threonine protein kinase
VDTTRNPKDGKDMLVMEYMPLGSFAKYSDWSDAEIRTMFGQILSAVDYLHNRGITHRDLKCQNILVETRYPELITKLCDFSVSSDREVLSTRVGTWTHYAPELLRNDPYTEKVDIWAMGVIILELAYELPWDQVGVKWSNERWIQLVSRHIRTKNGPLVPLLTAMLNMDHTKRPSARRCLTEFGVWDPDPSSPAPSNITVVRGPGRLSAVEEEPTRSAGWKRVSYGNETWNPKSDPASGFPKAKRSRHSPVAQAEPSRYSRSNSTPAATRSKGNTYRHDQTIHTGSSKSSRSNIGQMSSGKEETNFINELFPGVRTSNASFTPSEIATIAEAEQDWPTDTANLGSQYRRMIPQSTINSQGYYNLGHEPAHNPAEYVRYNIGPSQYTFDGGNTFDDGNTFDNGNTVNDGFYNNQLPPEPVNDGFYNNQLPLEPVKDGFYNTRLPPEPVQWQPDNNLSQNSLTYSAYERDVQNEAVDTQAGDYHYRPHAFDSGAYYDDYQSQSTYGQQDIPLLTTEDDEWQYPMTASQLQVRMERELQPSFYGESEISEEE